MGLATGLYIVWEMAAGPRRARVHIIYSGGALPVVIVVGRRVVDDGGAGVQSMAQTDTVQPEVAAGAVSSKELRDR